MNERIKELAEQAMEWVPNRIDPDTKIRLLNAEKFAELLVKECGQWFNNRLTVEPDYGFEHRIERNRAVVGVMKEYNEHFGIDPNEITEAMLDRSIKWMEQQLGDKKHFGVEDVGS